MKRKEEIVSFKVDQDLLKEMEDIPNRSEFIRSAILAALGNVCPLCRGSGILSPNQKHHWNEFSTDHSIKKCTGCNEIILVCSSTP